MGNLHVCPDCFGDESIKQFVRDNAVFASCDFCTCQSINPTAASWNAVLAFIREGLEWWWTTEASDLPYETFSNW